MNNSTTSRRTLLGLDLGDFVPFSSAPLALIVAALTAGSWWVFDGEAKRPKKLLATPY